jgi:hypothetical protein
MMIFLCVGFILISGTAADQQGKSGKSGIIMGIIFPTKSKSSL